MKKRLLSFLCALVILIGVMPLGAFAGDTEITVYVSVFNKGEFCKDKNSELMWEKPVSVKDSNGDGKFSLDEALLTTHETYYEKGAAGYVSKYNSAYDSNTVTSIWGVSEVDGDVPGFGFYRNNKLTQAVDKEIVSAGDKVTAFIYYDNFLYSDRYSYFTESAKTVETGKEFEVTLNYSGLDKNWNNVADQPVKTAPLGVYNMSTGEFSTPDTLKGELIYNDIYSKPATGPDGKAKISFSEAGTYYLSAEYNSSNYATYDYGDEPTPNYLVPSICVVTVVDDINAPVITKDLTSDEKTYYAADKAEALSVEAKLYVDGEPTYQWYKADSEDAEGVAIEGATESTYTPSTDKIGKAWYYVVVSNTADHTVQSARTAVNVLKPTGKLGSLIVHTNFSPSDKTVLVRNSSDSYKNGVVFDPDTLEYTLADQPDSVEQLRFRAAPDRTGGVVTLYYENAEGKEESKDITWKSGSSKWANCLKGGNNVLKMVVSGPADGDEWFTTTYKLNVKVIPTLSSLEVSADKAVYLDKKFASTTYEYSVTVPDSLEKLELTAVPKGDYTVKYNGDASNVVNIKGKDKVDIEVIAGKAGDEVVTTYTLNLVKTASQKIKINTNPSDAIVNVFGPEGDKIEPDKNGYYEGMFDSMNYTYSVTKTGYVAKTGDIAKPVSPTLNVTLDKAPESNIEEVSADWKNFRNSDYNMGITDAFTPNSKETTKFLWNKKLGTGWSAAPSVQIIVDDALVVMSNKTIYKLDLQTGEILQQGTMVAAPNWGYTPPAYAKGLIFCPLEKGTIQAFNAKTLESVWVYKDPLKGQSLSPIAYSDGYVYTGFWNSEAKEANFVCLSITDEDPTNTTEAKIATWSHTQQGGFYWAGCCVLGDYVVVGTDDGASGTSGTSNLLVFNKTNGKIVSSAKLENAGDQRSSIAYSAETGKVYFTTKGGYLYSATVDKNTGKISDLKGVNYNAQSTSTPLYYDGKLYFATGSGISSTGSKGNFVCADAETLEMDYAVGLLGYPQGSQLLSTAYADTGYLYFYSTYNNNPGGISMIKVKIGAETADDAELIEIYDAAGFEQFCITSIICGKDGTLYYKNDSANVIAVAPDMVNVESVELDKTSAEMLPGDELQLTAKVNPDNATVKSIKWTSSDESVATVDENGNVTAVSAGTATITATSKYNNEAFAVCEVVVLGPYDETENSSGVRATADAGVVPSNAVLVVDPVKGTEYNTVVSSIDSDYKAYDLVKIYDIHIDLNGVEIEPNGNVKIYIPIPEGFDKNNFKVIHVNDGKDEDMNAVLKTIDGVDYAVFETSHFSYYAIISTKPAEKPAIVQAAEKVTETIANTLDDTPITLAATGVGLAAVGVYLFSRKRRDMNNK